ncbi:MAG: heat-inducible transcription repressor HrcA [Acidobacteria bacterium]|nr:heat-inducible transcription repressor HrcA [Acidobacteriota bacterium]
MDQALPQRTIEVMHAIVQCYVETGEPVASRTIARRRKDNLSPATIRNIMADLADLGYLDQPHTSAGRVPTAKAFQHFAQSGAARASLDSSAERLREELVHYPSLEQRAEYASHVLTTLTRNVGIVAAIPASAQLLDQIELVRLSEGRVLMVVVTRDGLVHNQVAYVQEPLQQEDLVSIRNYVNSNFSGWALTTIRTELDILLREERALYDGLLRRLHSLYSQGLLSFGHAPRIYLEGTSNLVGLDLHLTREKLRELFRTLEEKQRLIDLLDQFLDARSDEVQVQVGLEGAHPAMRELSLIGLSLHLPGGGETRMAVLGPMRMNYPKVMAAVAQLGRVLQSLPQ